MPILTLPMAQDGPVLTVLVAVSAPRHLALVLANQAVPPPQIARVLIDTGASCTVLDPSIIQALGVTPIGVVSVATPSTGAVPHFCKQYDVAIALQLPIQNTIHNLAATLPVLEAHLSNQGIMGLIGRDILKKCVFTYNGGHNDFIFAF